MKNMKLKIKFTKETRFDVAQYQVIRRWSQILFGTAFSLPALALAEPPKPGRRGTD